MTFPRLTRHLVPALFSLLALPTSAQDILGVIGTWEMVSADDVPNDDLLVFSRMTFTGDRLHTTAVYLDADDGELTARNTDDRYIESAGQLIVQAPGSATVLDVGRTPEGLTVRDVMTGVTLRMRASDLAAALDPALVGSWAGDSADHAWTFRFEPDGRSFVRRSGQSRDHVEPYTVAGAYLLIDEDAYHFTVSGDRLTLDRENETITLTRSGVRPEASAPLED